MAQVAYVSKDAILFLLRYDPRACYEGYKEHTADWSSTHSMIPKNAKLLTSYTVTPLQALQEFQL